MKVILLQEIQTLGKAGDVKNVADGYARNFLIPQKLAEPATEKNLKTMARRLAEKDRREEKEHTHYQTLAEKLHGMKLRFTLKVGEKGQAFGSITARDIVEELTQHSIRVEKGWVDLEQGIKTAGEHTVSIKLPHQISSEVRVIIESKGLSSND